jgi:small-conductance mechanosensitive channel
MFEPSPVTKARQRSFGAFLVVILLAVHGWAEVKKKPKDAGPDVSALDADAPNTPIASALPAASAPTSPERKLDDVQPAWVRLHEAPLFVLRAALGTRSPEERARAATQALAKVVDNGEAPNVHVEAQGDLKVVYVGERVILEVGAADASAANDPSVGIHADSIATRIRDGLRAEQKRHNLLWMGLELLGGLAAGLLALLLWLRLGRFARAANRWMAEHPDRMPSMRVQSVELVRPGFLRLLLTVMIRLLTIVLQLGIAYGWLLLSLYLFEPTRGYTEKLTDVVLSPLSAAMSKSAGSLPVALVTLLGVAALVLLLRFVGVFFGSAARGETTIGWVPTDLIGPTSVVVRFGIVVLFVVVALPFITGNQDGPLSRLGLVVLVALGLASAPLVASACAGLPVVYGRGLRTGDWVSIGPFAGRVDAITLLDVRLTDTDGCEVRVPHLLSLVHATRVQGQKRPVSVTLCVRAPRPDARQALLDAATTVGTSPKVELESVGAAGASYRISVCSDAPDARHLLLTALANALAEKAIPLG